MAIINDAFRQSLIKQLGFDEPRQDVDTFDRRTSIERFEEIPVELGNAAEAAIGIGEQHHDA